MSQAKTLAESSRVRKWEKQEVLKSILFTREGSLREKLLDTSFNIRIQKYMTKYLKKFELQKKQSIKEILIDTCEHFYKTSNNSLKEIQNYLFKVLTDKNENEHAKSLGKTVKYAYQKPSFKDRKVFFPVVHIQNRENTFKNIEIALKADADMSI